MYLSANNHDSSTSILSIKEIIGIVLVFAFMLYLLFPKEDIDLILEGDGKNRNLSINYLESMLLYYPNNIKLQMTLVRNYREGGEPQKALKLASKLLKEVKDKKSLKELYRLEYLILKKDYFQNQTPERLNIIKRKLWNYFYLMEEPKDYTFFFAEASQLDMPKLKFIALKKVIKERPQIVTYAFEKGFFQLASYLKEDDDSYKSLLRLLNYPEVEEDIKLYAISTLFSHNEYSYAEDIAHELFIDAKSDKKIREYFSIVVTLLMQNSTLNQETMVSLIKEYQNRVEFTNEDIKYIIKNLLAIGDIDNSAHFAIEFFNNYKKLFTEESCELALNALIYNQQLDDALTIAYYAKERFPSAKWLDKTIQLSLWSGKIEKVMALNAEGFREYSDPKYREYLLKYGTFNRAYEILGEIAKKSLEDGDLSMVEEMSQYFEYTGEIAKGEDYFTNLYQKQPHQSILKEAISFSYKNNHFERGLKLYAKYKEEYGMDKSLQKESIDALTALKRHHEAYLFSKELNRPSRELLDMAQIAKDYQYLYSTLWKMDRESRLSSYRYGTLISLERELKHGERLDYLYKKGWREAQNRSYLYASLYLNLEKRNFKEIEQTLNAIKDKRVFKKDIPYHIFMANFYSKTNKTAEALKSFQKALKLDKNSISTHQAYLWFLLDVGESKALNREISLLRENPKLQRGVGFASVVGALQLQKSDLALRWIEPILKSSKKIEYQVVLADILELQDRVEGANKIRIHLFKKLNQQIEKEPKLLEEKEFARLYLQLATRYKTPFGKRKALLKKLKKLFSQEEYHELEVGYYAFTQSSEQVSYLASKYKMDTTWLNLYLAMSQNDNQKKKQLLETKGDTLAIKDRVKASLDIGDRAKAYTLAFQGLESNQNDVELYRLYNEMVTKDYPNSLVKSSYKVLSKEISLKEQELSYRWLMGDKSSLDFSLNHYDYSQESEDVLALTLKQQSSYLLWEASLKQHFGKDDFLGAEAKTAYRHKRVTIGANANYQTKTSQTPKLQSRGIENSLLLKINYMVTQRLQLGLSQKFSQYNLAKDKKEVGSAEESQIDLSYILRSGYPDIQFKGYLSNHRYEIKKEDYLPKDFSELGTQITIGERGAERLHQGWRPFGRLSVAINNHKDLGASLSIGTSSSIKGGDSLRLMLDYSKGIDMISQPTYGVHLEYRF